MRRSFFVFIFVPLQFVLALRANAADNARPTPSGLKIPVFTESDFPFVTIVADDGRDPSGGWQQAKVNLEFTKVVIPSGVTRWKCPITIQIPIRHSTRGYISPSRAANMSALVTNVVTVNMDFDLPQGIFCNNFVNGVRDAFPILLPNLGARVTR